MSIRAKSVVGTILLCGGGVLALAGAVFGAWAVFWAGAAAVAGGIVVLLEALWEVSREIGAAHGRSEALLRSQIAGHAMTTLYLNGRYMPLEEGRVSVEDRGFQFGDGVYEVVRVYRGKPFRLPQHLARLERSLKGLEIPPPVTPAEIEEVCRRVLGSIREATIYIQVTRGAAPRAHAFPANSRPTFLAYAREAKPHPPEKTFSLCTVLDDRWGRCNLKTICLLPSVLAKQKALSSGCDEGLFVREDGTVTEGTATNAFLMRGGVLVTHPATNRILDGITRRMVIDAARKAGIPVEERPFNRSEALEGDEFFMTGTLTEVMPAVSLDGRKIGIGEAGPVTLRLREALHALVREECGL